FFCAQGAADDALRVNGIHAAGLALVNSVANAELPVFEQGDEAPAKAEKIGGADHERLQKMFEIAAGAKLGRDLEQLMKLVRLGLRGGTKFGVSDGDGSEAGNG